MNSSIVRLGDRPGTASKGPSSVHGRPVFDISALVTMRCCPGSVTLLGALRARCAETLAIRCRGREACDPTRRRGRPDRGCNVARAGCAELLLGFLQRKKPGRGFHFASPM